MKKYTDICQSCGMPMGKLSEYGTNADGSQNFKFCMHCFQNGAFTQPNITMDEMIKGCIGIMVQYGTNEADAKDKMEHIIPILERWKNI